MLPGHRQTVHKLSPEAARIYAMNYRLLTHGFILSLAALLTGCALPGERSGLRTITVLYTNDEHGWMEGMAPGKGAADLYALWQQQEGYYPDGPFLILSGGDNWTGPAISTWTEGESMVEVMNAMHYDASAVGNHEFDFGLEVLSARAAEADFPYLSANTRWRESGGVAVELGILPYSIATVSDLRIGIVGLTTRDTATTTNPIHVAELDFTDYETALRETVPQVRREDIDLLFVISHVCIEELAPLINATADLDLDLVGAGHCNQLEASRRGDTVLLGGGYHFTSYAKASFTVDLGTGVLQQVNFATRDNSGAIADRGITALISDWSGAMEAALSEVVAFSAREVSRTAGGLNQAIVQSWLWHDPTADIAISNAGGIRIDLPAGEIDIGTLVAMMPFDNTIVALNLTGAEVRTALASGSRPVVAGVEQINNRWQFTDSGVRLREEQTYRVLVNSFMYAGGDGYSILPEADPNGFDTGIHYRQPFQNWLQSLATSVDQPLEL